MDSYGNRSNDLNALRRAVAGRLCHKAPAERRLTTGPSVGLGSCVGGAPTRAGALSSILGSLGAPRRREAFIPVFLFRLAGNGPVSDKALESVKPSCQPARISSVGRALILLVLGCFCCQSRVWGTRDAGLAAPGDSGEPASDSALAVQAAFANPPLAMRILKIVHGWPDDPAQQDSWQESLLQQGFGGVVCNVSSRDYLTGEDQWLAFERAVRRARERGMVLWLYDERGYPSGTAGGLVLRDHPEWQARGLLIREVEVTDHEPVEFKLPPGDLWSVVAYPVGTNGAVALDEGVDVRGSVKNGELSWQAPSGTWRLMSVSVSPLYEGTHAAMNLDARLPYPNLLSSEPTDRFIELTHEAYARRLPDPLGRWFVATFTDEPSLMSLFLRPMPYGVLPWEPRLGEAYRLAYGRELPADLPAIVLDDGPDGRRARHRFWQLVSQRVVDHFFEPIRSWCRRHGLLSGGHLLMEESVAAQVALYGDGFACLRRLDAPSIDCLTSVPPEVPWRIARLALSAAVLEGNSVTMCETSDHSQHYRPPGDTRARQPVSEAQIRGTFNRLLVGGINTFTSYYSFTGLPEEALRRLNEWVGRCALLLREGQPAADLAVVLPTESLWSRTYPSRGPVPSSADAGEIEKCFDEVCDQLYGSRRDFICIDSRVLLEAEVGEGSFRHGDQRWPVVLLPGVDTLPVAAWRRLETFVGTGGVLIALGHGPENSAEGFPSAEVLAIGQKLFGSSGTTPSVRRAASGGVSVFLPPGSEGFLVDVLDQIHEPSLRVESQRDTLRLTSRRLEGRTRHFLINDSDGRWEGRVFLDAAGDWERWDPQTGVISRIPQDRFLSLELEPYGGVFLCSTAGARSSSIDTGRLVLPQLALRPLPVGEPRVARGEFVREMLERTAVSEGQAGSRQWRVGATLVRGGVDTYLFLLFPLQPADRDWSRARCLALDTTVPEGQRTPAQLLVVLKEAGGAEYLASSGRSLGAAGRRTTHIFWSQFQLAGWSRDTNTQLDLEQIVEVRIGWGGYYGREREQVEFTVSEPMLAGRAVESAHP